ncbi:MAG: hypothetical protein HZA50_06535 [Planctomycetes bacterium]|nr:hypothetical protein [Planctomycetota bacterium]
MKKIFHKNKYRYILLGIAGLGITYALWNWYRVNGPEYKTQVLLKTLREMKGTEEFLSMYVHCYPNSQTEEIYKIEDELVRLGKPVVPILVDRTRDKDLAVQVVSTRVLLRLGRTEGIRPYLELDIFHGAIPGNTDILDEVFRSRQAKELAGVGPSGVSSLIALLSETDINDGRKMTVAKALGLIGDERAITPLMQYELANKEKYPFDSAMAILAIGRIRNGRAMAYLITILDEYYPSPDFGSYSDASKCYRLFAAIRGLGRTGDTRVLPMLDKMLASLKKELPQTSRTDLTEAVQKEIINAIKNLGGVVVPEKMVIPATSRPAGPVG